MKLNPIFVLACVMAFGVSLCSSTGPSSSTVISQFITIRIVITRTVNNVTTQQIFEISLANFQTLLDRYAAMKSQLPPSVIAVLDPIIQKLNVLVQEFNSDSTNEKVAGDLAATIVQLFNELTKSTDPTIIKFLNDFNQYLTTVPPVVVPPVVVPPVVVPPVVVPPVVVPPTITISIGITDDGSGKTPDVTTVQKPTDDSVIGMLLDVLKKSNTDPKVQSIIATLQTLLASYKTKPDYLTLIKILIAALDLGRNAGSDKSIPNVVSTIISMVVDQIGKGVDKTVKYPISVSILVSLLTQANGAGLMTNAQLDANIALLNNGKQNDPLNILRVLVSLLQSLKSVINPTLQPSFQSFMDAVNAYIATPSIGTKNIIAALTKLVDDVVKYTGTDKPLMVSLVSAIIQILREIFPGDADALNAQLTKLLATAPQTPDAPAAKECTGGVVSVLLCQLGNTLGGLLGSSEVSTGAEGLAGLVNSLLPALGK